jgi:periplasmic divalent cation tolerance protein
MGDGGRFLLVSTAAGDADNAREIASALVSERLAACVQVLPIESHYRWQDAVHHEPEFLLQIKTTADRLAAVEVLIKRLHCYDLPEISVIPIVGGSAEYLAWIAESTTRQDPP